MKNKGFSLVELIIVIAIMAIMIGIIAPQLIIYIGKTKVSNDIQICDNISEALNTTIIEYVAKPEIDSESEKLVVALQSEKPVKLASYGDSSPFAQEVIIYVGISCFGSGANKYFKSKIAKNYGEIYAQTYEGQIIVWINNSDSSGKDKDKNTCTDASALQWGVIASDYPN